MFYCFIIFNIIFSFGVQSFSLPHNANEISNANSGIANSNNININCASINNIKNSVSFSSIAWYQGVKGNKHVNRRPNKGTNKRWKGLKGM